MEKVQNLGISIIKQLGLILLVVVVNVIPMGFLILGLEFPIYIEVLLGGIYLLGIFFLVRTLWRTYRLHLTDEQKKMRIGWKDLAFALLFFLIARFIAIFGTLLNMYLTGQQMSANDAGIQTLGGMMTLEHPFFALLFPLTVALIAPIVEEFVFRGFASVLLFKKTVSWLGATITSLLFALPHISSITELPLYFAMGLVLYSAYARRGNIKDSILVHMLNNLPLAILLLISLFA